VKHSTRDSAATAMSDAPLLSVEGFSVAYRTQRGWLHALDDIALTIGRGQVLGLVGESGSGKSTVVLALLGLLGDTARVSAQRLRFDGNDLLSQAASLRGRRIGTVFQDPSAALNPALTIGLQVAEPMLVHRRLPRADAFARATSLLAELGIPRAAQVMHAYPHQLSGGMKQRVVIATALAAEPDLLLLDEPTTALDVTIEAQILDLLEDLRVRRGIAMLLVSHNLGLVERICDKLVVLYAGRTVETGPTADVLAKPQHPYTRGLLAALPRPDRPHPGRLLPIDGNLPDMTVTDPGCNFRARCSFAIDACATPQALLQAGDNRTVRCHRAGLVATTPMPQPTVGHERQSPSGSPLATAEGLARIFRIGGGLSRLFGSVSRDVVAVDHVSLAIRPGEVLGLVGESGSGKTTLGRLLLRLIHADDGRLTFDGTEIPNAPKLTFRRRAQIVFQNPDTSLNPRQTVETILRRPLRRFGLARGAAVTDEVDRLLELVRLPRDYRARYPHQLSGGEKQRVGIARALASRPDFLVCDEAVSALDVSVQAAILNLLADLRDQLGVAYLFISHDIGVVAHIADRIAVMYRGRIVEEGLVAEVLKPPYHPYTEALLSAVPIPSARAERRVRLAGDPGAEVFAAGCCFAARCPRKLGPVCDTDTPPRRQATDTHHFTCHIALAELAAAKAVL
jgi:peptide/nickel transport system ATP-binding protein